MIGLDERISINGEETNLREAASAGHIVLRKAGSYRRMGSIAASIAWFADLAAQSDTGGINGWEITEATYTELQRLGAATKNFD